MITRIGMAPRLETMTVSDFQEHWRTSHADAAGTIPGLRRYIQNHAVLKDGASILPYPGFDACSELDFDSLGDMDDGFASDSYQQAVKADERAFVDKSRFSLMVTHRECVIDGPDLEGVKLITFFRAHSGSGPDELRETIRRDYAERVHRAVPARHDLFWPDQDAHAAGRIPAAAEAAEMIWFESVEAATDFLHSDADHALAGRSFGTARLLARPVQVM